MLHVWRYYITRNLEAERERWVLWLPVLFATGIGIYFALPQEPSMWLTLAVIELTLLAVWLARHQAKLLWLLAGWGVMLAGFTNIQLKAIYLSETPQVKNEDKLYLQGRVVAADTNYRGNQRLVLENMKDYDGNSVAGRYKLTLTSKSSRAGVGDCVEMIATVRPHIHAVAVGAYQLDRKAYFEGLTGGGFISSRVLPAVCEQKPGAGLLWAEGVSGLRQRIVNRINRVLPRDEAGIAAGLMSIWTVKVPDVMADADGEVFAVRDESGKMVILPTRGNNYLKKVWLEKTAARKLTAKESRKLKAIYDGRKTDRTWIDMACDERSCLYKKRIRIIKYGGLEIDGKDYDLLSALGSNFYIDGKNVTVKTVRGAIGRRLWNN